MGTGAANGVALLEAVQGDLLESFRPRLEVCVWMDGVVSGVGHCGVCIAINPRRIATNVQHEHEQHCPN
jgi:hypothetical protein